MTRLQLLLGKLAEEAAEISQIALKAQQFGLNPVKGKSNKERCQKEINDLLAVVKMLNQECGFDFCEDMDIQNKKIRQVQNEGKTKRSVDYHNILLLRKFLI